MNKKSLVTYVVIIFSFFSLFSCNKSNDVELLKQRIDELVKLIEHHKGKEIKNYFSSDFSGTRKFNKTQFFLFVHYHLKRNKNISMSVIDKEITHNKNYSDVTANVLVLGSSEWLPERGQIYRVASRWKKEGGDWKISNLRWEK